MVYCGKASQGCQHCRTRRIKCDKVRPECSQCVRLGKKCPGYRDQLSLMFRDESSKVMQKAHAQWGVEPGEGSSAPSSAPPSSKSPPSSATSSRSGSVFAATPASSASPTAGQSPPSALALSVAAPPTSSWEERGVQFYVDHYLLGFPDEPKTPTELYEKTWLYHPSIRTIMAAVGLAARSNLTGDDEMKSVARHSYVSALQDMGTMLANPQTLRLDIALRGVVMLAMFEVVKGTHEIASGLNAHIMGAAALINSAMARQTAPAHAFRGLMQLCYSMLIPCLLAGVTLPASYFGWVAAGTESMPEDEKPAGVLLPIITRFVHLSAYARSNVFGDGRRDSADLIEQALQLDAELERWEREATGKWVFTLHEDKELPAKACFHGRYHVYADMWAARIWSHHRWARILVNQMILEFVDTYPTSGVRTVSAAQQSRCLAEIRRLARDVLISVPTHVKHPLLTADQRAKIQTHGGSGAGAAGVPATLFHLKVAACAPGVPREYWTWALSIMETVWGDMGMLQAKSLAEVLRAHQDALQRGSADGILKIEPVW